MTTLKKKVEVIMLPTKYSTISLHQGKLGLAKGNHYGIPNVMIPQHLYFVDDSPIKEGDWIECNNKIGKVIEVLKRDKFPYLVEDGWSLSRSESRKVIATTDKSLKLNSVECLMVGQPFVKNPINYEMGFDVKSYLPQPSDSFIASYIKAFNEGTLIKFVMVDYEKVWDYDKPDLYDDGYGTKEQIKVDKSNTITITRCKDSWGRE